MKKGIRAAANLHKGVPPDWYNRSLKPSLSWYWPFQWYWHRRRFREVLNETDSVGGKILDIGSADGIFTKQILDRAKADHVIGIDVLEKSVDWANSHWKSEKLEFRLSDAHKLNFPPNTFDSIFALEVLEHVSDPLGVLAEVKRVMKKGAYAVFLVPSDNLLFRVLWDNFWTKTRGKIWDETHIQTYRNDYLVSLSKMAGFKVLKSKKFILGMLHLVKVKKV